MCHSVKYTSSPNGCIFYCKHQRKFTLQYKTSMLVFDEIQMIEFAKHIMQMNLKMEQENTLKKMYMSTACKQLFLCFTTDELQELKMQTSYTLMLHDALKFMN